MLAAFMPQYNYSLPAKAVRKLGFMVVNNRREADGVSRSVQQVAVSSTTPASTTTTLTIAITAANASPHAWCNIITASYK